MRRNTPATLQCLSSSGESGVLYVTTGRYRLFTLLLQRKSLLSGALKVSKETSDFLEVSSFSGQLERLNFRYSIPSYCTEVFSHVRWKVL